MILHVLPSVTSCNDRDAFTFVLRKPLGLVSPVKNLDIRHGRQTFLRFHLVEKIVTFYSLGHGHNLVRHESGSRLVGATGSFRLQ